VSLLADIIGLYIYLVVGRAILSFFPIRSDSPFATLADLLQRATEPLLAPIRRVLPPLGGLDFSPVVLIIGLQIVRGILVA
jgi:YggT family protein